MQAMFAHVDAIQSCFTTLRSVRRPANGRTSPLPRGECTGTVKPLRFDYPQGCAIEAARMRRGLIRTPSPTVIRHLVLPARHRFRKLCLRTAVRTILSIFAERLYLPTSLGDRGVGGSVRYLNLRDFERQASRTFRTTLSLPPQTKSSNQLSPQAT